MSEPSFFVSNQPWVKHAACTPADEDVFFDADREQEALRICNGCGVRMACGTQSLLEEGAAPDGRYGVRGGMTPAQREVVHRRGGLHGVDPKRAVANIPLDGIPWSRHHTTLARKLCLWLNSNRRPGQRLPSVPKLCEQLGCNPAPLRHVLTELWATGVLDKASGYVYAGPTTE